MLLQQLAVHADTTKKMGVERQWRIHNPLAKAPIVSELNLKGSEISFLREIFINLTT